MIFYHSGDYVALGNIAKKIYSLLAAIVMGFGLSFAVPSYASTYIFSVNSNVDAVDASPGDGFCLTDTNICTLRAAIQEANALVGNTIEITITVGTVNLSITGDKEDAAATGDLDISGNVKITGIHPTIGEQVVINASGLGDRVFHILGSPTVVFTGISIENGNISNEAGGGINVQGGFTTIENVTVKNNAVEIVNEEFTIIGGGIYIGASARGLIKSSIIESNTSPSGGGITNFGRVEVRDTIIKDNEAAGYFIGGNFGGGYGGGFQNFGGYVNMGNTTITGNTANLGGGFYNTNAGTNIGNAIITNTTIDSNTVTTHGGGIFNLGPITLSNSTISNNTSSTTEFGPAQAGGQGGGIANMGLSNMDIINTTISGNSSRSGGGIYNARELTLTNVTIFDNTSEPCTAGDLGCELVNGDPPAGSIGGNQVTINDNDPNSDPGITLVNTIIADGPNSAPSETVCAGSTGYTALVSTEGHNIESDEGLASNTCGLDDVTDNKNTALLGLEPNLAVQTIDGVDSTAFHALLAGSDAIDAGSTVTCPVSDQRFLRRDKNDADVDLSPCDIGAYEYGATTPLGQNFVDLKLSITDTPDPIAANDPVQSLQYKVTVSNLYVEVSASGVAITINLPSSVTFLNIDGESTSGNLNCDEPPYVNNQITCSLSYLPSLGQAEIFIAVRPTVEGTITASASVTSITAEAFPQNNSRSTSTLVTGEGTGGGNTNYITGSGGSGGGSLHPLALLLTTLLFVRRRLKV